MSQLRVLGLWLCIVGFGAIGAWGSMWLRETLEMSTQRKQEALVDHHSEVDVDYSSEEGHQGLIDIEQVSPIGKSSTDWTTSSKSLTPSMDLSSTLQQADQFIVSGNCHAALRLLSQSQSEHSSQSDEQTHRQKQNPGGSEVVFPPEVSLRIAACAEELRRDAEALQHYESVIRKSTLPNMRLTATLGKCRIWSRRGNRKLASEVLCHEVLNSVGPDQQRVHERLFHQWAQTISQIVYESLYTGTLTSDLVLVRPELRITAEELLRDATEMEEDSPPQFENPQSVRTTLRLDDEVEGIYVSLRFEDASVQQILQELAKELGVDLQIADGFRERSEARTTSIRISELPVSILLDAMLFPIGYQWEQLENVIRVWRSEENDNANKLARREQARRALRYCSTVFPHHSSAIVSRLHQAAFSVQAGDVSSAKHELSTLVMEGPSGELRDATWLNLGKCQLLEDDAEAVNSFFKVFDVGVTSEIDAAAGCLLGRLLLRNDRAREAVVPLRKGLAMTGDTIYGPQLSLLLASALLMSGEPTLANEVLIEESMSVESQRAQSALLVSLIRLQHVSQIEKREALAADLLRAYTNLDLTEAQEEHWCYLAAIAANELGLTNEVERLCTEALQAWPEIALKTKLRRLVQREGTATGGVRQVIHSSESESDGFVVLVGNESAVELEEKYRRCLEVVANDQEERMSRREALRIMGRIEQMRGNHREAIQCFSGLIPIENDAELSTDRN
ncbi:hypothetical protein AB1L42_19765 [Thalassoglobus sp. JC818]|uniref:hypothetical protein n=1 Tax=Thalassoglobus sp. JC818 TaxID=3232136 RepID=UPI0034582713